MSSYDRVPNNTVIVLYITRNLIFFNTFIDAFITSYGNDNNAQSLLNEMNEMSFKCHIQFQFFFR